LVAIITKFSPSLFLLSLMFGLWLSLSDWWKALKFFFYPFPLSFLTLELFCKCLARICCGVMGLSINFFPFKLSVYWFVLPQC
jgi:hypothetical protein